MSIPRKKSRSIEVDGRMFRYMIKDSGQEIGSDWAVTLTVQEDTDRPGRVLQVDLLHGRPIEPAQVQSLIQEALKSVWNPSERGTAVRFTPKRY